MFLKFPLPSQKSSTLFFAHKAFLGAQLCIMEILSSAQRTTIPYGSYRMVDTI